MERGARKREFFCVGKEYGADWQQRLVSFQMPSDPHAFISENKDRDFDGESPDTELLLGVDQALTSSHRRAGPRWYPATSSSAPRRSAPSVCQLGKLA